MSENVSEYQETALVLVGFGHGRPMQGGQGMRPPLLDAQVGRSLKNWGLDKVFFCIFAFKVSGPA